MRFKITNAWLSIMFELDVITKAYDVRTRISELQEAAAGAPYFEYGRAARFTFCLQMPDDKPYMVVRIEAIDHTAMREHTNVHCCVQDETGDLEATLHLDLVRTEGSRLRSGTCLILHKPALFSPSSWDHHLIIAPGCIVHIRTPDDPQPEPSYSTD